MLICLIADVHSNAQALKAVLSTLKKMNVQVVLHAGDIVGYNPYPDETIELFRTNEIRSILGNHDRALITGETSTFNPYAAFALNWTRKTIKPENLEFISGLKNTGYFTYQDIRLVIVHGSPGDLNEYIFPEDVRQRFLIDVDGDILVLGHTHVPFIKEYADGTIVNPGSVGQPRDGNPKASYAILDTISRKIKIYRITYDIEKVIKDMLDAHFPEGLANRLMVGR